MPRCERFPCIQDANGYDGHYVGRLCYYCAKLKLRLLLPWTPGPTRRIAPAPKAERVLPGGRHHGPRLVPELARTGGGS